MAALLRLRTRFPLVGRHLRRAPASGVRRLAERDDADLWVVGVLLWIASAARVALAIAQQEVFGGEATLALGCVVGLPWLLLRSRCAAKPR